MKKHLRRSLLVVSLLPATVWAQWTTPAINTRVSGPTNVGAATPLSVPGPEGSTYITWFESASGYRLMMQRLDAEGVALWPEGGIEVSAEPQSTALFRFDLKSDHAGNAIVAFQDERSGSLDIVAYRVAPDGSPLWEGGLSLPTPGATGLAPEIGVLTDDRVVITWTTDRSPATVAWCILPATGDPTAPVPQEIGTSGIHGRPKVVPNADGGFWIQYVHQPGNFLSPGTMMAQRFDADGASLLTATVSSANITGFYFPEPISDGRNGLYVAFNSGNAANASMTDVYVQRLRADGSKWSSTGTPVETGSTTNRYANGTAPALIDEVQGLMIAYSRKNGGQSEGGVNVQRFDTAGVALLGPSGALVVASSSALPEPFGTVATEQGAVFGYTTGGFNTQTMHAVQVDLAGVNVDAPSVIALGTTASSMDDATLTPFQTGQAVAVWQDQRNGGCILAQPVTIDISTGVQGIAVSSDVLLLQGTPDELLFTGPFPGTLLLTVHTADGKRVMERRLSGQVAGSRVPLHWPELATGILLVRITGGQRQVVLRTVR